jgi:hypothetical protein
MKTLHILHEELINNQLIYDKTKVASMASFVFFCGDTFSLS